MSHSMTAQRAAEEKPAFAPQPATPLAEFPREFLSLLRCSRDAGRLVPVGKMRMGGTGIVEAELRCSTCASEYRIEDGIARMLHGSLTAEDEHEMALRNGPELVKDPGPFAPPTGGWRSEFSDLLEVPQHLAELQVDNCRVLEFGCGDGRFTMLMAQRRAKVLAVDFSVNALKKLAWRLPSGIAPTAYQERHQRLVRDLRGSVGLVHGDASHFHVAPRSFNRAFSTTPLDSQHERMAMYRTIADALTDDGRFVGSVEYDDLIRQLLGLPKARRYSRGGIFIEHFDHETMRREVTPYFSRLHFRLIRPRIPLFNKLPLSLAVLLSRTITVLPVLRHCGEIQVLRAERPVRPPVEGVIRPGNRIFKSLFRWYMLKTGRDPMRDGHEAV